MTEIPQEALILQVEKAYALFPRDDPCIIGLDITAVIGLSLLGVAVLLGSWTLWLVLQTTLVFIGAGMRYHRVYVRDSR